LNIGLANIANDRLHSLSIFVPMPYEVDFTGCLSNTVAPKWLERLRIHLIRQHFFDQNLFDKANLSVITRSEIDYVRPIRIGARVFGHVWVEQCMRASWTIGFVFFDASTEEICLRARQVGAFVDPETFTLTRVPKAIQERVAQFRK
jgi:acyl-CoA thioester hydrolase